MGKKYKNRCIIFGCTMRHNQGMHRVCRYHWQSIPSDIKQLIKRNARKGKPADMLWDRSIRWLFYADAALSIGPPPWNYPFPFQGDENGST